MARLRQNDLIVPLLDILADSVSGRLPVSDAVGRVVEAVDDDLVDYHRGMVPSKREVRVDNWAKWAGKKLREAQLLADSSEEAGFYALTQLGRAVCAGRSSGLIARTEIVEAILRKDSWWLAWKSQALGTN